MLACQFVSGIPISGIKLLSGIELLSLMVAFAFVKVSECYGHFMFWFFSVFLHILQASCYCICLTALHLAEPQYAWVVVPVELEEILVKVGRDVLYQHTYM